MKGKGDASLFFPFFGGETDEAVGVEGVAGNFAVGVKMRRWFPHQRRGWIRSRNG